MPIKPPKCKFCDELHWGICPNVGGKKRKPDIKAIEVDAKAATSKPKKAGRGKAKEA